MQDRVYAERIFAECEKENETFFREIDRTALANTEKVLAAFRECRIAERHLKGTTGY